jgi:hypothetical protein
MLPTRKMTIGSGRPTGPAMPPGRRTGVGGACAQAFPAGLQSLLPVHQQFERSRGPEPGGLPAHLPHAGELSHGVRRLPNMADQRDPQSASRPLSPVAARPDDRFSGRPASSCRGKAFAGAHAGQSGHGARTQPASAVSAVSAFAGIARGNHFARLAGPGIQRDSTGSVRARGNCKIADQSRAHRTGADIAGHGSEAVVAMGLGK